MKLMIQCIALLLGAAAACVLAVVSETRPAYASARISPIVVEVGARGRGAVRITNLRDHQVTYQLTPLSWVIVDSEDVHEQTNDFIASPPSFSLAPGRSREVRVGCRNPARSPVERAYRLVVEEVPFEVEMNESANVRFHMRHVLPVYVAPASKAASDVIWSVRRVDGNLLVRGENRGNVRTRIDAVGLNHDPARPDQPMHVAPARNWILAQSWREWTVAVPAGVALETLMVRSNPNHDFQSVPFSQ